MKLMNLLPEPVYHGEAHIERFQEAIGTQVEKVQAARDDLLLQCRPSTATWGMARYEREWGLAVDENKPLKQRLAALRAKRRGLGVINAGAIKLIAESFYNGEVEVVEHKQEFWFEVIFLSLMGIPPNLDDLKAAVEEAKPAHMEAVYVVVWNTHKNLSKATHNQLAQFTHKELRTEKFQ